MGAKRRRRTKVEFSKKIMLFAGLTNVIVIGFTLIMVWRTCDLSPLQFLIPAVAAETATGTAFYYAKAKVENRIKLAKKYKMDISTNDEMGGLG